MSITPELFLQLFVKELEDNKNLWDYYKFLKSKNRSVYDFRIKYFQQRLQYIYDNVKINGANIWDCGCGYATIAIFLTLNGHKVYGNTLEFYSDEVKHRLSYWSKFGPVDNLQVDHQDVFKTKYRDEFDYVIAQDTLHHLEPNADALKIIHNSLKHSGKLVVTEINGNNLYERLLYFRQRGNKRIIGIYDDKLDKTFLMGNENIRSLKTWKELLIKQGLIIDRTSINYIRFYYPIIFSIVNPDRLIKNEQFLWKKSKFLREYFYFGLNFMAEKSV